MKFAYLIIAHGSFELLKELIKTIDSPDNDIFIHFDSKVGVVDITQFKNVACFSNVISIDNRVDVKWGHVSIVKATLNLLEASVHGNYDYFHLLSGVDFPIKSNSYIQSFFKKNKGKEFIGFSNSHSHREISRRVVLRRLYHGRPIDTTNWIEKLNYLFVSIQDILHLYRIPINKVRIGPAWFSITKQLAEELVSRYDWIVNRYKHLLLPDEMFLQTYMYENNKMESIYNVNNEYISCCRAIDWKRGLPYVWRECDFDELINSPYLWARKFSEDNLNLIKKIENHIV